MHVQFHVRVAPARRSNRAHAHQTAHRKDNHGVTHPPMVDFLTHRPYRRVRNCWQISAVSLLLMGILRLASSAQHEVVEETEEQ